MILTVPWKKPISVYDSAGPKWPVEFWIEDLLFYVQPTKETGITTGRTRYRVSCVRCDLGESEIHRATTGPAERVRDHLKKHGYDVKDVDYAGDVASSNYSKTRYSVSGETIAELAGALNDKAIELGRYKRALEVALDGLDMNRAVREKRVRAILEGKE